MAIHGFVRLFVCSRDCFLCVAVRVFMSICFCAFSHPSKLRQKPESSLTQPTLVPSSTWAKAPERSSRTVDGRSPRALITSANFNPSAYDQPQPVLPLNTLYESKKALRTEYTTAGRPRREPRAQTPSHYVINFCLEIACSTSRSATSLNETVGETSHHKARQTASFFTTHS